MLKKPIRVLNIEDSERDVILLTRHLNAAGYAPVSERVETAAAMKTALKEREWDIILCDYSMPRFNALKALKVLRQMELDIPFIIISGTVGEDVAVKAMLTGADDYLPKDNLTRLVPAIERELHQAENRREQKRIKKERRVVFEIIQGSITAPNLDEFLKLVHGSIGQIVYAENCIVMLHDPATDTFAYNFWADKRDPLPAPRPVGKGFSSYVLRTGRPLLLTKELKKEMVDRGEAILGGTPSLSWVGIPLRTPTRTIGVLILQHYEVEHAYSQRDLEFLSSIGNQIALAIERKRAEDALGESEVRYRDLVENALDMIFTLDLEGNFTSVNQASENMTGYTSEEAMTMNTAQFIAPEYQEIAATMVAKKLAGQDVLPYELEVIAKDGGRVAVEVNTRIIYKNDIPVGLQGIGRDITERKQLEEQFRQSQKMEAIGVLAGGVAHDFNNLLTAILGYSDLTLRKMSDDDPLRNNIQEIKVASERAGALTSQLLAFSRKQVLKPTVHNLNSVVTDIENMLRRIVRENIEFRTVLAPDLGNIKADPGQIEQVIMNLAVNSRDAMPDGAR